MLGRNTDLLPLAHPQLQAWPETQACAPNGNPASSLFIRRPVLYPLSHTGQG